MILSILDRKGPIRTVKEVIVRDASGQEVFKKDVAQISPKVLQNFKLTESQLQEIEAARKSVNSGGSIQKQIPNENSPAIISRKKAKSYSPPPLNQQILVPATSPVTPVKALQKVFVQEEAPGQDSTTADDDLFSFQSISKVSKKLQFQVRSEDIPGYENVGGKTCYCNAVIRALVSCSEWEKEVLAWFAKPSPLIQFLAESARAFRTQSFDNPSRSVLPRIGNFCKSTSQEDAHEFLLALFDTVEKEVSECFGAEGALKANFVSHLFQSILEKTLTCAKCQAKRSVKESFLVHSLSLLPMTASLQDLLVKEYLNGEALTSVCEVCQGSAARLEQSFLSLPRILVLHLNRHEKSQAGFISKISTPVDIPLTLQVGNAHYELSSVVFHTGASFQHGHYTTVGRRPDLQLPWMMFDDNKTTPFDERLLGSLENRRRGFLYFYSLKT